MEKYTIIKQLGQGCFGSAYKVLNKEDNQIYVMKKIPKHRINKEEAKEAQNEAKILSRVSNEHIVKYYESFYSKNSFNIVMEYCDGSNLQKFIENHRQKNQRISKEKILSIILDICDGLKEIHNQKIIHKDLKPDNIFLTNDENIKIGDFGISKQLYGSKDFASTCFGPILYMAPEEMKRQKFNNKVDIWSLGCVIHELCTLELCFKDPNMILIGNYPRIDQNYYGHFLQNLIDLLLSQDYQKRPSAQEIIDFIKTKHIPNNSNNNHSHHNDFIHSSHRGHHNIFGHHSSKGHRESHQPHLLNKSFHQDHSFFMPHPPDPFSSQSSHKRHSHIHFNENDNEKNNSFNNVSHHAMPPPNVIPHEIPPPNFIPFGPIRSPFPNSMPHGLPPHPNFIPHGPNFIPFGPALYPKDIPSKIPPPPQFMPHGPGPFGPPPGFSF